MALSGTFNSPAYGNNTKLQLQCSWSAVPNAAGNYSDVTVVAQLSYYSLEVSSRTGSISIDNNSVNYTVGAIDDGGGGHVREIMRRTYRVYHNADGTKTVNLAAYYPFNGEYSEVWVSALSASTAAPLDPIARNPDAPTTCAASAGHGSMAGVGETVSLSWSGASGIITGYEVQVKRGSADWAALATITTSGTSGATTDKITVTAISQTGAGKSLQYRVRAMNGALPSAWKTSNVLTMGGGADIRVNGAWKTGSVWRKVNGVWKRASRTYKKISGTWKESK